MVHALILQPHARKASTIRKRMHRGSFSGAVSRANHPCSLVSLRIATHTSHVCDFESARLCITAISFRVDLSAAGCGCNVAMEVVSMHQNKVPGTCAGDFYCDASNVCGVRCAEIDRAYALPVMPPSNGH